jgi:micrococcal nuclease
MKELADAKNVFLETDTSQGERDKFGRLLAYVYLEDGQMLNRKMIAEGYAYEYTYLRSYKYQEDFKKAQNLARSTKVGLWADNACGLKNINK